MKNIHLLPTEKPSRLHFDSELFVSPRIQLSKDINSIVHGRNIYITCDKEPKEDDWCFGMDGIFQYKGKVNLPDVELPKKIILTTDPDLIADGVQAIDDEFLEWFVKNPSCKFVEVRKYHSGVISDISEITSSLKIIIPQEEPKQYPIGGYAPGNYYCTCVTCKTMFQGDKRAVQCEPCAIKTNYEEPKHISAKPFLDNADEVIVIHRPKQECTCGVCDNCEEQETIQILKEAKENALKQETLEEAANNFANLLGNKDEIIFGLEENAFIEGAKWQAERMYSEEDFKLFARQYYREIRLNKSNLLWDDLADKCLEQFKNKEE